MTTKMMNKTTIRSRIVETPGMQSLLNYYRDNGMQVREYTNLPRNAYNSYAQANGLINQLYVVSVNDTVIKVILPLFSTSKTITWNMDYMDSITSAISKDYRISKERLYEITSVATFVLERGTFNYAGRVDLDGFVMYGNRSYTNSSSLYIYNKEIRDFAAKHNKK